MLKKNNLKHIAIILDGNQRWSDKKKLNIYNGYEEGLKKIDETITYSLDLNFVFCIRYIVDIGITKVIIIKLISKLSKSS